MWGYSLALGPSVNGIIGDLSDFGLNNVGAAPNPGYSSAIPELLYFAFQLKFAAITPALIIGAFAERIRFKALLIYIVLWTTLIYAPIAHREGRALSMRAASIFSLVATLFVSSGISLAASPQDLVSRSWRKS